MNSKHRLHLAMKRSAMIDAVYEHLTSLVHWQTADLSSYSWSQLCNRDPTRPTADPRFQQSSSGTRNSRGRPLSPLENWIYYSDDLGTYALRRKVAGDAATRSLLEVLLRGEQLPLREHAVDQENAHAELLTDRPRGIPEPPFPARPEHSAGMDVSHRDEGNLVEPTVIVENVNVHIPWRTDIEIDGTPLTEGLHSSVTFEHSAQDLQWLESDSTLRKEIHDAANNPDLYAKGARSGRYFNVMRTALNVEPETTPVQTEDGEKSKSGGLIGLVVVGLVWFIMAQCS